MGEGIPTTLIGVSVLRYLTERPAQASWLTEAEKTWLENELAGERHAVEAVRAHSIFSAMGNVKVLLFTTIFAGVGMSGVGLVLFLPQILKGLGMSNTQAGLLRRCRMCSARWRSSGLASCRTGSATGSGFWWAPAVAGAAGHGDRRISA